MRDTIRLSLILGLICVVSALVLSGVDSLTRRRVEQADESKLVEALALVLPGDHTFEALEGLDDALEGHLGSVTEVFAASGEDSPGIAAKARPQGYGGQIDVVVGVTSDGLISGVQIVSQSETPGLGSEVTREAFTDQFRGSSSPESVMVRQDGGSVDAITGATISSRAVASGVRDVLEVFARLSDLDMLSGVAPDAGEEGPN